MSETATDWFEPDGSPAAQGGHSHYALWNHVTRGWDAIPAESDQADGCTGLDVERLAAAMSDAYTYADYDNGIPTLPWADDFETFWDPFAAAVIARLAPARDDTSGGAS